MRKSDCDHVSTLCPSLLLTLIKLVCQFSSALFLHFAFITWFKVRGGREGYELGAPEDPNHTWFSENPSSGPLHLSSAPTRGTGDFTSSFYHFWPSLSSFSNMYPEEPQFWINLSLSVCTSTSWLSIIRGGDTALLLSTDTGKTTTQVRIPTSQQVLGLRSFMSLDNLSKPSYFHPSSKFTTHLAFKKITWLPTIQREYKDIRENCLTSL